MWDDGGGQDIVMAGKTKTLIVSGLNRHSMYKGRQRQDGGRDAGRGNGKEGGL